MEKKQQNKRAAGAQKEELAAKYLEQIGYQILCRNFYSRFGELDLIARDGRTLVFCEVKYRKNTRMGHPTEAVSPVKLTRMRKTAQYYCIRNAIPENCPKRFDVISILGEDIVLYRDVTGF